MDGTFVPPITFGTNMVELCRKHSPLFRDVHLMIEKPARHFEKFIQSGAQGITFHIEASSDPLADIQALNASHILSGISLRPETPIESLLPVLPFCSLVLVMTVSPGYGGQAFLKNTLDKVAALAHIKKEKNYTFALQVDGGINAETATLCAHQGATHLVAGTFIFQSSDRKQAITDLRLSVKG
jgi:ribulose-phosphate 3-epimerase